MVSSIIALIKEFFIKNKFGIFLALSTALFIIPIIYSCINDWKIPDLLIFYDIMFVLMVLIMLGCISDNDRSNNVHDVYDITQNQSKTYGYSRSFYNTEIGEKTRNGGLTNKEVSDRKQLIRKRIEKIKTIKDKEEITNE
jgi:hypothetical protein